MAATHTTNLGLNKPARGDFVSVVSDINDNMDKIDAKFGDFGEDTVADKFTGIDNEIGNTELPTTAQTLTGAIDEHEEDIHGTGGIDAEISAICQTITGTTNNTGHTINSGEYFIANGGKYQATASIPNGQTWSDKSTAVSDNDIINALNSKTTITITKLWANEIDLLAEKNNRIICCSGWIKLNASAYTDQMPLFRLNATITNYVYFNDNNGDVYRLNKNGEVIFHSSTTIPTNTYRFVSFAFCN